jgi:nitrogen fixation/metabolism regulation signal transduction histidine kinase
LATFAKSDAQTLDRMTTTIIVQVEAMRDMLNAFADYARPPKFTLTLINFNPLIAEVVDLYQSDKVKIITQLANNLPPLNADSGRLRQVLHNLIKNAIEASCEQQRINILLTTSFCQESTRQFIECRIRDKGCGVAQEDLEEVFEPYITHKIKGTGLGLAIVKKIIEEHGGIIWLENNPDVGACVVMRFPQ